MLKDEVPSSFIGDDSPHLDRFFPNVENPFFCVSGIYRWSSPTIVPDGLSMAWAYYGLFNGRLSFTAAQYIDDSHV